ncbi:crotonase/enoyl-CoA hydratase family protein [Polaromonas sp. CG_23.6]|uniref:crotonase/enoyl-CoA hydratase family protein n=1 Tax=Polaromonas sp. CG_23.6 TaxID=2760709 RepID=UPI00247681C5|nr:crotonase/enoyl-CoA hydratase family protein [Polaromonas sp. CG_23.6]MDH6186960.1 enoyl-CoA hydratase/carnithine racemase [Polaromonas sp. CG_23.6]
MTSPLLIELQDGVCILTLNRPETRNPISDGDTIAALEDAVLMINRDHAIRAVVLTGAGSAFSSGGNVKHMQDREGMFGGTPAQLREGYRNGIQRIPRALYHCEVPTIAAVNGPAIGAGCDLALMCDMRIASDNARFAESFVKVGIIPGDGGAWLLPRAIGLSRACEMAFTGDAIDASTALAWGLVSQVVAPGQLMNAALALARRITVNPPDVLRMTKKLLREGQHSSLESLLELSAAMQALAHHTRDHQEAVNAMLARRVPVFTGE